MQTLFDTDLMLRRRAAALARSDGSALFLMRRIADDLEFRLGTVGRRFEAAASLHSFTGHARDAMLASGKTRAASRIEPLPVFLGEDGGAVAAFEAPGLKPESLDLAVSLLSLHLANDLPGMLIQIRRALRPDGLFLAALPGAGTLSELRESLIDAETELLGGASPRVMPFVDVRDAGALLQRAGFALPVADVEPVTVRYDTLFDLVADLRGMGETNVLMERSRKPVGRNLFARAAEIYAQRFSDPDGRLRATFSIIWMSGWAPHASQQKPLTRGSASVSLADVLGRN